MANTPDFSWKDVAYCIGLVLSAYNLVRARRKDSYDPLVANFFGLLDKFAADTASLSDEIGRYLQKTSGKKEYDDLLEWTKGASTC